MLAGSAFVYHLVCSTIMNDIWHASPFHKYLGTAIYNNTVIKGIMDKHNLFKRNLRYIVFWSNAKCQIYHIIFYILLENYKYCIMTAMSLTDYLNRVYNNDLPELNTAGFLFFFLIVLVKKKYIYIQSQHSSTINVPAFQATGAYSFTSSDLLLAPTRRVMKQ